MQVVDLVEACQGREQPPVGLGDLLAEQVATPAEQLLEPVEALEQGGEGTFVGPLMASEARAVDAVVDRLVDAVVDRVDPGAERLRVEVQAAGCAERSEAFGVGEDADDLAGLVVDDPSVPLVPEDGDADVVAVAGLTREIRLAEEGPAVQRVAVLAARAVLEALAREGPAAGVAVGREIVDRHRIAEPGELADDHRAMRPRAGERDVQVKAARLGRRPRWPAARVGSDPVAEGRVLAQELAAVRVRILLRAHPGSGSRCAAVARHPTGSRSAPRPVSGGSCGAVCSTQNSGAGPSTSARCHSEPSSGATPSPSRSAIVGSPSPAGRSIQTARWQSAGRASPSISR